MSEKEVVEKKVVSRNLAIIVIVILSAGLIVEIANYTSITYIANLGMYTDWLYSPNVIVLANSYTDWTFSASYAGYVSVYVKTRNISAMAFTDVATPIEANAYVRVIYSAYGVQYDNRVNVGTEGTAVFPILPCSNIEIRVGNTNSYGLNFSATVTITYHY